MYGVYAFISEQFKLKDEYRTKEEISIWQYDLSSKPNSITLKKGVSVKILDCSTRWWKVKHKIHTGYASKYYFAKRSAEPHESKDWFFGELPSEESEKALKSAGNKFGSFLVRCKENLDRKVFVLSVRHYKNDTETQVSKISHFEVDVDEKGLYSLCSKCEIKSSSIDELISHHKKTPHYGLKLTDACLLPAPHSDPGFLYTYGDHDTWFVPRTELEVNLDDELGHGTFGTVYSGIFRTKIKVAVKIPSNNIGKSDKVLRDFTNEKNVMARLNHPNLVQLYAVTKDKDGSNILVLELMESGSLLQHLKRISMFWDRSDYPEASFKSVLGICVQVARGMAHLERLNIVHRDLAARNVLLDETK